MSSFLEKHPALAYLVRLVQRYSDHHIARDSAALTYYLLFAIFPLLIFLNNLIGLLSIDISGMIVELSAVIPRDVLDLAQQYLDYISRVSSRTLLWFSLVFTIYFPFRAANALFLSVRKAYGLGKPVRFLGYQLRVLLFTILLIVTIGATLFVSAIGRHALNFASEYIYLSEGFIRLWTSFRFVFLGAVVFFVIAALYALAQDGRRAKRTILPGVLSALVMWMLFSMGFSFYVEHAANYSVIYGSIGAIIVLLLWLYLSAVMLIMGAEVNSLLIESGKLGVSGGRQAAIL